MSEVSDDNRIVNIFRRMKSIIVWILAITVGLIHRKYVSTLFENDRHFSHLSELEREMSFRTEMGFYYSFYKTVVEERPFMAGIVKLMYDKLVEFPKEVNALNRFNIMPEVLIGSLYRYLEPWLNSSQYRECHTVDRGGHTPVDSCVGIGQPILFYLEAIWCLAAVNVSVILLHAYYLSASILGASVSVLLYFANHAEVTRVQWAPNERENFALPLLLLQTWVITLILRNREKKNTLQLKVALFLLNSLCLLFWQFTQFIFLTQLAILFLMEQLLIIDVKILSVLLHSHFCGLHMAVLVLNGNDMLKTSLYTSLFLMLCIYCMFFSGYRIKIYKFNNIIAEACLIVIRVVIIVVFSIYLKRLISDFLNVHDDTHIWDLLYSKFTDHKNFHTLLYTCSEVFDFLPWSSYWAMILSLLIPLTVLAVLNALSSWVIESEYRFSKELEERSKKRELQQENEEDSGIENNRDVHDDEPMEKEPERDCFVKRWRNLRVDAAIFYMVVQCGVFMVLAALVMRLKLLSGTYMCILAGTAHNEKYYRRYPPRFKKFIHVVAGATISTICMHAYFSFTREFSHLGEFSDYNLEDLLGWVKAAGSEGAFAGSMPLMATVLLTTRRPVVLHPHYEHEDVRDRTYAVYKVYGRFTPQEYYTELANLQVTYLIVENKYCRGRSRNGCTYANMWDIEAPHLAGRRPLCEVLANNNVDHFYPLYANPEYMVFRIHDVSVRYMPRSFDT